MIDIIKSRDGLWQFIFLVGLCWMSFFLRAGVINGTYACLQQVTIWLRGYPPRKDDDAEDED